MHNLFPIENSWRYNFAIYTPNHFIHVNIKDMTPTIIILCGIPTSGKSVWAEKNLTISGRFKPDDFRTYKILSRDSIRFTLFGKGYKQNNWGEKMVTGAAANLLQRYKDLKLNIILDNTHCREEYIKQVLIHFENTDYRIKIKFFDIPLWKAYYRNVRRKLFTGKWIPIKVIKAMKTNYDKIDKKKYEHYVLG